MSQDDQDVQYVKHSEDDMSSSDDNHLVASSIESSSLSRSRSKYPGDDTHLPEIQSNFKVFVNIVQGSNIRKDGIWHSRCGHFYNYQMALESWMTRLEDTNSDDQAGADSFELLKEWWNNDCYDFEITQQILEWITKAAEIELSIHIEPRLRDISKYNDSMFRLWLQEFSIHFAQSIGAFNMNFGVMRTPRMVASRAGAFHRTVDRALASLKQKERLEVRCSSQKMVALKSNIYSCCWLPTLDQKRGAPYYLWDRVAMCTRETSGFKVCPPYIAVSHTWGRWRTGADAKISGVPWLVPCNQRFVVETIPGMLRELPFSEPFVWLDLVCIPQADPVNDPIAKQEIAKQSAIFRAASKAIAWIATMPSWNGLEAGLEYAALLHASEHIPREHPEVLQRARQRAQTQSHLIPEDWIPRKDQSIDDAELQPWFTSLWTLQELCLRPDMLLCDSEWRPLILGGFQVPLDHAIELVHNVPSIETQWPLAMEEFGHVVRDSGLSSLPKMSALTVVHLGELRYCESRRAEAIMSAVGCTDWFLECPGSDPGNKDLVLGKYPLAFLQELRLKMPGAFFAIVDHQWLGDPVRGTLLPFSAGITIPLQAETPSLMPDEFEEHPAVATWTIQRHGGVEIPEAAVLAAYPYKGHSKLDAEIEWYQMELAVEGATKSMLPGGGGPVELNHLLASFWPHLKKYAVCLMCEAGVWVSGFVVVEIEDKDDHHYTDVVTSKPKFRKLVNFHLPSAPSLSSMAQEPVDIIVV